MQKWNIFFTLIAVFITTASMLPRVFGMQDLGQWGGMYIDGWCSAKTIAIPTVKSIESAALKTTAETIGSGYKATMQNRESCIAWAQSWCNQEHKKGWKIIESNTIFAQEQITDNTCKLPTPAQPWFTH